MKKVLERTELILLPKLGGNPTGTVRETYRVYSDGVRFLHVTSTVRQEEGALVSRELSWGAKRSEGSSIEDTRWYRGNPDGRPSFVYCSFGVYAVSEYYVNEISHRLEGPAKITRYPKSSGGGDKARYMVGGYEVPEEKFPDVTRCLVDPDFAMKNVSDPILKYPASRCLGDGIIPY